MVMVAYLWEYAQVTKDDLSPQLATLFPVSYWNISCKCAVNEELEYSLPFEFWIEIGENEKSELVTQFFYTSLLWPTVLKSTVWPKNS